MSASDVVFVRVERDRDDGRSVYDLEFYAGNTEYDYEIDSTTGKIVSADFDIESYTLPSGNGTILSVEEARNLVLAKVPGASAEDVRISLDRDDGRQTYEGELYYNQREYEFEMDAATGNFIEWSAESWH